MAQYLGLKPWEWSTTRTGYWVCVAHLTWHMSLYWVYCHFSLLSWTYQAVDHCYVFCITTRQAFLHGSSLVSSAPQLSASVHSVILAGCILSGQNSRARCISPFNTFLQAGLFLMRCLPWSGRLLQTLPIVLDQLKLERFIWDLGSPPTKKMENRGLDYTCLFSGATHPHTFVWQSSGLCPPILTAILGHLLSCQPSW